MTLSNHSCGGRHKEKENGLFFLWNFYPLETMHWFRLIGYLKLWYVIQKISSFTLVGE